MLQMYKVFFDGRTVFFTDEFEKYYQSHNGLFVRYLNEIQLAYVMELFRNVREIHNVFIIHPDLEQTFKAFRSFFREMEAAGGLVFDDRGRVLVIHRRGKWDLPKGKLEQGEDPETTAVREVEEECGITSPRPRQLLHVTFHSYNLEGVMILKKTYWYHMDHPGDEKLVPQTHEDITEVRWMAPGDLGQVVDNTYGSIIEVLEAGKLL
ncbi:MAG: NUDIX domain-containing protein [Bacteroidales bacterium]|nr:NUDIX domain-containing protein [Bacteroidales bacterium]